MTSERSLHNTYPYDEVLADAVEALAIAQALNNERVRLENELANVERACDYMLNERRKWREYATAWEAWCDGEGTTRPQRQAYGL